MSTRDHDEDRVSARIPANVETPDKLLARLTARQLAILSVTALVMAVIYLPLKERLPLAVVAIVVFPVGVTGAAIALGRREGLSLDRFALSALAHLARPKRLVAAPEGVPEPPAWCRLRGTLPAPVRLPVRAIRSDGVMELAGGGTAALVAASTVSFSLRTPAEQAALTGAFARLLNSLEAPVQILVRAKSADLSGLAAAVEDNARALPHPALEQAAREHAAYLDGLGRSRDLLYRQVLLVVTSTPAASPGLPGRRDRTIARDASAEITQRRAEEAERALAALEVSAQVLDAGTAADILADCLTPGSPEPGAVADPDQPITAQPTDDTAELEVTA